MNPSLPLSDGERNKKGSHHLMDCLFYSSTGQLTDSPTLG